MGLQSIPGSEHVLSETSGHHRVDTEQESCRSPRVRISRNGSFDGGMPRSERKVIGCRRALWSRAVQRNPEGCHADDKKHTFAIAKPENAGKVNKPNARGERAAREVEISEVDPTSWAWKNPAENLEKKDV